MSIHKQHDHARRRPSAGDGSRRSPPFSFRLDQEIKADLERFAAEDVRSLSGMIDVALRDYVKRRKG